MRVLTLIASKLATLLNKELSGSGWDGNWSVDPLKNGFLCKIEYHNMNDGGFYDGWHTVNVYLDLDLEVKRITFTADKNTRKKYLWSKEYFEDCVFEAVKAVKNSLETLLED